MSRDLLTVRDTLLRFVRQRVRDPWVCEDIVQETLTRYYAYRQTASVIDASALCFRIAINLVRDHFRRGDTGKTEILDDELAGNHPAADDLVMHRQRVARLQQVIEAMPPLRREVFRRRRLQGQSLAEICRALDLTEAAAKKHMVRAVETVRLAMAKLEAAE
jgi:RNA polymerase sigma-70 factor (ECF subfamily)